MEKFNRRDDGGQFVKRRKIGILTWHYYLNFGSALQAYALKKAIEKLGHRVAIINYRNPKHGEQLYWKDKARVVVSKVLGRKGYLFGRQITYPFLRFHSDYLKLGQSSTKQKWLKQQVKKYDAVVCGSDQIWAPNVVEPTYLLDVVPDDVVKISYAASIGLDDIPEEKIDIYTRFLKRFSHVSVREERGKELLETKCGISSEVVLDPTLLLPIETWRRLERKPTELGLDLEQPFLFCYFLKADNKYKDAVVRYAKSKEYNIVGYSLKKKDHEWMFDVTGKIGPREFLWLIHHAKAVATDSYHGTIFSLLNHQNFFTFRRFSPEDPICQNSRIEQLDRYFSIKKHIVNSNSVLSNNVMDYEKFESKLTHLRKKATMFLKNSLGEK